MEDAHEAIDTAISTALKESKPVYISIGCNLPAIPHPTFSRDPVPFSLSPKYATSFSFHLLSNCLYIFFFNFTVTGVIESLDLLNNLNHKHSICMFCSFWYLDTYAEFNYVLYLSIYT